MSKEFTGEPMDHGWMPHRPETWTHKFASLKESRTVQKWQGHHAPSIEATWPAGTRVRIVMVSRLGDVGITDDLTCEVGYHARVAMDQLTNYGEQP